MHQVDTVETTSALPHLLSRADGTRMGSLFNSPRPGSGFRTYVSKGLSLAVCLAVSSSLYLFDQGKVVLKITAVTRVLRLTLPSQQT